MKEKLILIGSGMVGARFIERLLIEAPDKYDITVFNKEPTGGYNRIMLSPVLSGEKTLKSILTHDEDWFEERNVHLHTATTIVGLDKSKKTVTTKTGDIYDYDVLVVATGSSPFIIPVPGHELAGVVSFRDIRDVDLMIDAAKNHKKAVVIGGGLLGLEAANGLKIRGMDVTVIHLGDVLMEVQMDKVSGQLLKESLEEQGLKFAMGANTEAIEGTDRVTGVRLKDGTLIPAELVVMAVGIRPNIALGDKMGLETNRGILVNDQLQTSDENIYSLGECVEHDGNTFGLVAPLYEQAQVLAEVLSGKDSAYRGSLTSTMLKVTGISLFSTGDFEGDNESEQLIYSDLQQKVYRKIILKDNKIIGSVMFGNTSGAKWIFDSYLAGKDMSEYRDTLVFGEGYV